MTELLTEPSTDPASADVTRPGYLELALDRVRLLLQREALRLRGVWRIDPLRDFHGLVVSDEEADRLLGLDPSSPGRGGGSEAAGGPQEAALGPALAGLEARLASWRPAEGERPDPLRSLVDAFGLTPFERDVVVLCLARGVQPQVDRLLAYLQDDAAARYPTPDLAARLFAEPSEIDGWRSAFTAMAPLRRFHLVRLEAGPHPGTPIAGLALALNETVEEHLLGVVQPEMSGSPLLRPIEPLPLAAGHVDLVEWVDGRLGELMSSGHPLAVNLVGPPGAGKEAVAAAVFERAGLRPMRLDASGLPAGAERDEVLGAVARDALLFGLGIYLALPSASERDGWTPGPADVVRDLPAPVVVGTTEPVPPVAATVTLRVDKPTARDQQVLWAQALGPDAGIDGAGIHALVQQFDLGPSEVAGAVRRARGHVSVRVDGTSVTLGDLWRSCREGTTDALDSLAQRVVPSFGWDDIVVPEDVEGHLREISAQVRHRSRVYEDWGFGDRLPRGRGISALFAGPSGTGKTMAAEVLATNLELDLFVIDLAGVVSKYIGETEKNLRRVFDAAERSGAILFFDEADALFGKRTEVRDSHDRYANIEVDYLLQRMESYRGLAILATNMKGLLDPAFLRRLRFVVDFPFPGAAERRRIWEKVFPPHASTDRLNLTALARLEIPGGSIRNVALGAAFLAAAGDAPISMDDVMHAARREYRKIDKLMLESDFGPWYSEVAE